MAKSRAARMALLCLGATLLFTPACKDDEVVATYTCGDGVCSAEEDLGTCPKDCVEGPLFPGPCTGDSTAVPMGHPNHDLRFEYEMIDSLLRLTVVWEGRPEAAEDDFSSSFLFDVEENLVAVDNVYDEDGVVESVVWFFYDAEFRLTGSEVRSGDGAEILSQTTHEYDATGFLVRKYTESFVPTLQDDETLYEWNADNTFCTERIDFGADGTVDETNGITYDASGLVIRRENGPSHSWCEFTYDHANLWNLAPGAQVMLPWLEITRHARLTFYVCGNQGEGADNRTDFFYDQHGNLIRTEHTPLVDSTEPSHFTSFYYGCWQ